MLLVIMLPCFAIDEQISFELVQTAPMDGVLKACDNKLLQFHVGRLQTPSGVQNEVILRTADVISCSVRV